MDTPPSIGVTGSEPFVSFKPMPEYTPKYQWVDDERSKKAYITYDDNVDDKYMEYVPVFQVMKEYYEEEKQALYRYNSWSSLDEVDYQEYYSDAYVEADHEDGCVCDIGSPPAFDKDAQPTNILKETEDVPLDTNVSKFMYT